MHSAFSHRLIHFVPGTPGREAHPMVALGRSLVAGSLLAVMMIPCARLFAQTPQYGEPQPSHPPKLPVNGPALGTVPNYSAPAAAAPAPSQAPPTEKIHVISSVLPPGGFPEVATPMLTPNQTAAGPTGGDT